MKTSTSIENRLLKTILQGRLDFFRSSAIHSPLEGADFQDRKYNVLYSSGMDYALCNGVIEHDKNRFLTEEEIDSVVDFFSKKNLPFIWWTSVKILENKGFQFGGVLIGIALDLSKKPIQPPAVIPNIKIKIVNSITDLDSFTSLAASIFAMSAKAAEEWLQLNTSLMEQGEQINFLAFLDEIPVGTVTLSTCGSFAGIWDLAILPQYRKQGIGTALANAALLKAQSLQYNQVMAILMPKRAAWGLFTKLGFQEMHAFPVYLYGISAKEFEK